MRKSFPSDNTVLVTGAGGFIGSAVVRRLVKGYETKMVPCFSDGSEVDHVVALLRHGGSEEALEDLEYSPRWSIRHADISNHEELRKVLEQTCPRAILHLAFEQKAFNDISESEIKRLNETPLRIMFEFLQGVSGSRLIHTSSVWVLKSGTNLAEDTQLDPLSPYARVKVRLDKLLPVLGEDTGVNWIGLRLFNVYGKYESKTRLLPSLVTQLSQGKIANLSHGNQVRDFNDVDDIAEAYILALKAEESACCQIYHIGTGKGLSVKEFAKIVAKETGHAENIRFGSVESVDQNLPELVANPTFARNMLGWSPPDDPTAQIQRAVRWWLQRNKPC